MLLICIFAYVLATPPPLSCAARRRRVYLFDEPIQFTGRADLFHLFITVRPEVT